MRQFLIALCFVSVGMAAERGAWTDVEKLKTGDRIRVQEKSGESHSAAFAGLTGTTLMLLKGTSQVGIERDKIERVQVKSSARRGRNAAIGAGIGVVLGLITDQTLGTYLRNETGESSAARVGTVLLPAALFGGIGAALPPYRTVYRAPKH